MSYARFGWEDSDVYVFLAVEGHLECCSCPLANATQRFPSTAKMIDHLDAHRAQGHTVPDSTYDGLRAEADENDAFMRGERDIAPT